MKGVILAAGDGGRLRPLTLRTPKVLLEVGGRPLICYSLEALSSAGISEVAVVVGYRARHLTKALKETHPYLNFIFNESYDGGNALSVYVAREFVSDEPFVLCMGDHPISPEIVERLLSEPHHDCVLCIDTMAWHPSQTADATRVMVSPNGDINEIGKSLKVWNAIDTGVFQMTRDVFPVIEHLRERQGDEVGISDVVRYLGQDGHPFATCDISGMFWADVDTLEDYESIDSLLSDADGRRR